MSHYSKLLNTRTGRRNLWFIASRSEIEVTTGVTWVGCHSLLWRIFSTPTTVWSGYGMGGNGEWSCKTEPLTCGIWLCLLVESESSWAVGQSASVPRIISWYQDPFPSPPCNLSTNSHCPVFSFMHLCHRQIECAFKHASTFLLIKPHVVFKA